jgi:hypothetical protein
MFLATDALTAQTGNTDQLYGSGVRAFYRGQLDQAIRDFDLATAYGSQDPRVYFFRGVAKLRQGRSNEARFDFADGARLEAAHGRKDVGSAIQRIQGAERQVLEEYRRQAKRTYRLVRQARPARSATVRLRTRTASPPSSPARLPVAEVPLDRIRLTQDSTDPFAAEDASRLGQGKIIPVRRKAAESTVAATVVESDDAETAPEDATAFPEDATAFDETTDPLDIDSEASVDAGNASTTDKKSGAFGSAIRALTRPFSDAASQGRQLLMGLPGRATGPPAASPPSAQPPVTPAAETGGDPFFAEEPAAEMPADDPVSSISTDEGDEAGVESEQATEEPTDTPPDAENDPFQDDPLVDE